MFPFGLSLTTLLLIMGGILLGVVALGVLLGVLLPSFGVPRAAAKNLDEQRTKSANWARYKDVKKDLASPSEPDPRRLPLCRLNGKSLSNRPYRSIQVIAPSGAGKTPRVVVPAVLGHFGPAVITSIKGDVLELTRAARAAQGKIWVISEHGLMLWMRPDGFKNPARLTLAPGEFRIMRSGMLRHGSS